MKIWHPQSGTKRVETISGDLDHFGNEVAEGRMSKDDFWPAVVKAKNERIRRTAKELTEMREKYFKLAGIQ